LPSRFHRVCTAWMISHRSAGVIDIRTIIPTRNLRFVSFASSGRIRFPTFSPSSLGASNRRFPLPFGVRCYFSMLFIFAVAHFPIISTSYPTFHCLTQSFSSSCQLLLGSFRDIPHPWSDSLSKHDPLDVSYRCKSMYLLFRVDRGWQAASDWRRKRKGFLHIIFVIAVHRWLNNSNWFSHSTWRNLFLLKGETDFDKRWALDDLHLPSLVR
jgi:hypothetical protein